MTPIFNLLLLQAGGPQGGNPNIGFLFIGLMFLVFYFFMIRPQAKKQKAQDNFINNIQKGDEIVMTSGVIGKINKIEENVITLEVGNKTYLRVLKTAISKELTESLNPSND